MKISILILAFGVAIVTLGCEKENSQIPVQFEFQFETFIDARDNHEYKYIEIGNQTWMAENLAFLPSVSPSSSGSWGEAYGGTLGGTSYNDPYYYVYHYQGIDVTEAKATNNFNTVGVLYNWPAAMSGENSSSANPSEVQGCCPEGWHLPSDEEWKQLEMYLGMSQEDFDRDGPRYSLDAGKLKDISFDNDKSNNESGFSALKGGRNYIGQFQMIGHYASWWSSTDYVHPRFPTEIDTLEAWNRDMNSMSDHVNRWGYFKHMGFSVRCVKD